MNNPIVSIRSLSKHFGKLAAVRQVSIDIGENEFFSLLGPSGCGKTTLLRMIAGLELPDHGELLIGGTDMATTPANQRPVNMVFQSYAVFPHMSVLDNVAYGLRVTGTNAREAGKQAHEALEMVQLDHLAARRPDKLSGGQRQRVALARALVKRPRVLLLDEPLSALDAKLREQMQSELTRLQKAVGITFIMVTHDQHEALSMSDRIAVMDAGEIAQIGSPQTLYEQPANRFVADFIGRINLLDISSVQSAGDMANIEISGLGILSLAAAQAKQSANTASSLAIRPEHVSLLRPDDPVQNPGGSLQIPGRISRVAYMGDSSQISVESASGIRLFVTQRRENTSAPAWQIGDEALARLAPEHCLVLPA